MKSILVNLTGFVHAKEMVITLFGVLGGCLASLFGGWDNSLTTLLIFMGADFLTGLVVAGVFHKSKKTESGTLESKVSWKGLCKKGATLAIVLVACRIDILFDTSYFRDASVIAFILNELISICENYGLMGGKIPKVIKESIDILSKKVESEVK